MESIRSHGIPRILDSSGGGWARKFYSETRSVLWHMRWRYGTFSIIASRTKKDILSLSLGKITSITASVFQSESRSFDERVHVSLASSLSFSIFLLFSDGVLDLGLRVVSIVLILAGKYAELHACSNQGTPTG